MKQLTQNLKSGSMQLSEVPINRLEPGNLLVKTKYSVISIGTEATKVENARKSYIGKAKAKPDQVRKVVESIKAEGIVRTYNKVMNVLDSLSPLGYSCAGKVIGVMGNANGFKVGDCVACGGKAFHAEVNSTPLNLCTKIPPGVQLDHAAYTTLGAIAMQGFRQSTLCLGECCVVIGLGLVGQLTVQILKAAGVRVAGIDIDKDKVDLAKASGALFAFERNNEILESSIYDMSGGYGVDAVIITAGSSSLDPVELAGKLCRKRGKVVIVGAVPTGFTRENYYKKELSLLMSCSYGPGRYDSDYEEKGIDYPISYVRWTENRNMQSFLQLLEEKKLNLDLLTSHVFPFEQASKAYDLILNKYEKFTGILLKFDDTNINDKIFAKNSDKTEYVVSTGVNIGFIGAGSFAQKILLPNAKKFKFGNLIGVATSSGYTARNIADRYGFNFASADYNKICSNDKINTVFIATRHNLHASQVLGCLRNNKNVFVEKPLCLTEDELMEIADEYSKNDTRLMVGFNRRFSPLVQKIIEFSGQQSKKAINYRINSGFIPADSWIQDKTIGGGRIIGEVCHFIDLAMYIAGSPITNVSAYVMADSRNLFDTVNINMVFKNESIATISYFSNGSKAMKKEYLEVFTNGLSMVLDDFQQLSIYGKKEIKINNYSQDKGHAKEVQLFLESIINGSSEPIGFNDIFNSTLATLRTIDSIKTGKMQNVQA